MFVDSAGDYSGITKGDVSFTEGVSIADMSADTSVGLTGILLGDVNDTYTRAPLKIALTLGLR
jgi:hypothetical protein